MRWLSSVVVASLCWAAWNCAANENLKIAAAGDEIRLKLKTVWDGRQLTVKRARVQDPGKDAERGQAEGTVTFFDAAKRSFRIGPVLVELADETRFEGVKREALRDGVKLEVGGRILGPGRLRADVIEPGSGSLAAEEVELIGALTGRTRSASGDDQLVILGVNAVAPRGVYNPAQTLTRRPDERRVENQFSVSVAGRPLTVGGTYDATVRQRSNFDLDRSDADRVVRLDQELKVGAFYPFNDNLSMFVEAKAFDERELTNQARAKRGESGVKRGQTWVFLNRPWSTNLAIQLGRQTFTEAREWWWDADLDAARLYYDAGRFGAQVALAQELAKERSDEPFDPEKKDIARLLGQLSWRYAGKHRFEAFVLRHVDRSARDSLGAAFPEVEEDAIDARLTWVGLRAIGEQSLERWGRLGYWADVGVVRGSETEFDFNTSAGISTVAGREERKVRGRAFDLGLTWATRFPFRPAFTLGYAYGSGDDDANEGVDRAYRQSGLHNNNGRFRGVNRFRYYGELLRPELSNLRIATAAIGFPLGSDRSVEVLWHRYTQDRAADFLRDTTLRADPNGLARELGDSYEIIFGFRNFKRWEFELVGGVFRPGAGFAVRDSAKFLLFEAAYNF